MSYLILKNVDDHLVETSTTVALALGAYVLAESLHVSGILSVVAAGFMVGNIGLQTTSPTTQLTIEHFWEFLAFVANSLVFLFIGLEVEINQLIPLYGPDPGRGDRHSVQPRHRCLWHHRPLFAFCGTTAKDTHTLPACHVLGWAARGDQSGAGADV